MFPNWQSPLSFIKLIFELASKFTFTRCKPVKSISLKIRIFFLQRSFPLTLRTVNTIITGAAREWDSHEPLLTGGTPLAAQVCEHMWHPQQLLRAAMAVRVIIQGCEASGVTSMK